MRNRFLFFLMVGALSLLPFLLAYGQDEGKGHQSYLPFAQQQQDDLDEQTIDEQTDEQSNVLPTIQEDSSGFAPSEIAAASPPKAPTWRLIFRDEFNGKALNANKWYICFPWYPNAMVENGCPGNNALTNPNPSNNGELQWYQPSNILVQNGKLRLRAQKERVFDPNGTPYSYTSAMITSQPPPGSPQPGFHFQYGFLEARLRVPRGQGFWPAFWLLPVTMQWPPEIDLMEMRGSNTFRSYTHLHYGSADSPMDVGTSWSAPKDFAAGWHKFAIDWQPHLLIWYIDGMERFRVTHDVPQEKLYLAFNLAIGGNWPGHPDATTPFPSYFDIDYVRVWQRR